MKICVHGLWHLGTVTAACLADAGLATTGLDPDAATVAALGAGEPPLFEPGLADLIRAGRERGTLSFTTDAAAALDGADILWVAFDTPVDDDDRADVEAVTGHVERVFPHLGDGTVVLISSQLPVGTTARLEARFRAVRPGCAASFAYSPENLRLGRAIEAFTRAERIVAGVRDDRAREVLAPILARFTDTVLWMEVESAEMAKHALNAYLATSVAFINEIAALCERTGADAFEVGRALKADPRIGPRAYLRPGPAFAGGTLARDVNFLVGLAREHGVAAHLIGGILPANDDNRLWPQRQLAARLDPVAGRTVAVLGLAYTAGTDTLRRSAAVELCRWLGQQGGRARAYDPAVRALPADLGRVVTLAPSAAAALDGADALFVATDLAEARALDAGEIVARMARPLVIDQGRILADSLAADRRIEYLCMGRPA